MGATISDEEKTTASTGQRLNAFRFWNWPRWLGAALINMVKRHHAHRTATETTFFFLYWALLAFLIVNILALVFAGEPLIGKGLIPNRPIATWDDFRNVTFGIAGAVGATFGLYQLFNSATRTRLSDKDAATRAQEAETKQQQERNERFVRAAELLKDEDASVRMAGVFAMERLALEPEANYAQTVANVLAGFVRDRTTRPDYPPNPIARKQHYGKEGAPEEPPISDDEQKTRDEAIGWGPPSAPVSAAVTALSTISKAYFEAQRNTPEDERAVLDVDLRDAQLPRLEVDRAFMRRWNFARANLARAQLWSANLESAYLGEANLESVYLGEANLESAKLYGANLESANLGDANLENANFAGAILTDALFVPVTQKTRAIVGDAFWPTGAEPNFDFQDEDFEKRLRNETDFFDKEWCTDPKNSKKLHPELVDDSHQYKFVPNYFQERRQKELAKSRGAAPKDDAPKDSAPEDGEA
ncbi:MAG: pentapeptide repeat-containing protein [Pseudomonadota bacterium]